MLFAGLPQPVPRLQRKSAGSADAGGGEEQGHPSGGLPRYHGEGWVAPWKGFLVDIDLLLFSAQQ